MNILQGSPKGDATQVKQQARVLGQKLSASPEMVAFIRQAQAVNEDAEVKRLVQQMRLFQTTYLENAQDSQNQLVEMQNTLEALPVVAEYRRLEQQIRALLITVETVISQTAGIPFAELAKPSGHG